MQEAGHARVRLMDAGEITQLSPPRQRQVRFSGFFPPEETAERFGECTGAEEAAQTLKEIMAGKKAYPLRISGIETAVSMQATLESLTLWQEAGDGSVFYTAEFKEYRTADSIELSGQAGNRSHNETVPARYTVLKGDTLWGIAKRFLGDGARYKEIAALSGVSNPNLIYPGQVLTLPGKAADGE